MVGIEALLASWMLCISVVNAASSSAGDNEARSIGAVSDSISEYNSQLAFEV